MDEPSLWSTNPNYPTLNNPSGTAYIGEIAATGSNYSLTIPTSSSISLSGLTIDSSNATVDDDGTLEVDGTLALQAGTFYLAGTLSNATVTASGGTFLTESVQSNTLNNINIGTGAWIQANPGTTITNGLTFSGGSMSAGNGFAVSNLNFSGAQPVSGTGQILFNAAGKTSVITEGTLTLGAGITLRGSAVQMTGDPVINNGTIEADGSVPVESGPEGFSVFSSSLANYGTLATVNGGILTINQSSLVNNGTLATLGGGRLTINPSSFVNNGTLAAINGGTLAITGTGSWTNNGTIIVNNSTLGLGGSFSASDIANLQQSDGTIVISGTFNNAGNTLELGSNTGIYELGGTINGGTVSNNSNSQVSLAGVFNGVTLAGGTTVPITTGLSAPSGINFANGALEVLGGVVTFGGPLTGTGSILINDTSAPSYNGTVTLTASSGASLSIGSGITISALPTAQVSLTGNTITNNGTIQVSNGGYLTITGALTNNGTITANGGELNLAITNFSPAILPTISQVGGQVNLAASYNNAGQTLALTNLTGSMGLNEGGQITGGTISTSGNANFYIADFVTNNTNLSGELNGVTIAGNLVVQEQGNLWVKSNLTLQNGTVTLGTSILPVPGFGGNGTQIYFDDSSDQITGTGQILFEATADGAGFIEQVNNGTLTIGPNITIGTDTGSGVLGPGQYSSSYGSDTIINQGVISSQTAGQFISVLGNAVNNGGTISASNGGTLLIGNLTNTGLLICRGSTLELLGKVINQGTISLDHGAAIIDGGTFTQTPGGNLDLVLNCLPTGSTLTDAYGTVALDGELSIELANGYTPAVGTQWTLVNAGTLSGVFSDLVLPSVAGEQFEIQYSGTEVTLVATPEPAAAGALGLSAGLLLRRSKRRPKRITP